jgi:hypothetical protein
MPREHLGLRDAWLGPPANKALVTPQSATVMLTTAIGEPSQSASLPCRDSVDGALEIVKGIGKRRISPE